MKIPWGKIAGWLYKVGLPWLGKKALKKAADRWLEDEIKKGEGK